MCGSRVSTLVGFRCYVENSIYKDGNDMILKRLLLCALCASLALSSCAVPDGANDASLAPSGDKASRTSVLPIAAAAAEPVGAKTDERFTEAVCSFSERLFTACAERSNVKNLVISPISVIYAMTLLSNGAVNSTLEAFEGLNSGIPVTEMNEYLFEFSRMLAETEESTVDIASSVWANAPIFTLNDDFVTVAKKYYDALARSLDFSEAASLDEMNDWVAEKTDGMIKDALTELDPTAATVLLNTVLFNGKWDEPYSETDIRDGEFTSLDGTVSEAVYMDSVENSYFEVSGGVGFVKPYRDGYSFVGILPDEEVGIERFVAELDLSEICRAINESSSVEVHVSLPRFEYENELSLKDILCSLGLDVAFSGDAELGGLGSGAVGEAFLSDVLQKARIITDENGTKAAAVTEAILLTRMMPTFEEPKYIELDRPFFYMVIENETLLPLFMGKVG